MDIIFWTVVTQTVVQGKAVSEEVPVLNLLYYEFVSV